MSTSLEPISIPISTTTLRASAFRALHHNKGDPLLLANAYDAPSARTVASIPGCKALATASWAVAHSLGKTDETLTLEDNLAAVKPIAEVAHQLNLPLTVDIQDGYAGRGELDVLRGVITRLITEFGAVGVNLEDSWHESKTEEMMTAEEGVERIRAVLGVARELGVGDFVVNARSDTFLMGGELDESIRRGKRYLEAGAEVVFIFWPRENEMRRGDVKKVIDELGGRVNLSCRLGEMGGDKGGLTPKELGQMGAARVSVGPQMYLVAMEAVRAAAGRVFELS